MHSNQWTEPVPLSQAARATPSLKPIVFEVKYHWKAYFKPEQADHQVESEAIQYAIPVMIRRQENSAGAKRSGIQTPEWARGQS
jgi:hypothetical protein